MSIAALLPPMGGWESLHPLVVHLPIGILYVAGIWVALGICPREEKRKFDLCGLLLVVVGVASAWVTVATGRAAAELVERTEEINAVLSQHAQLAVLTRNAFTVLAGLYAALVLLPLALKKTLPAALHVALRVSFGGLYLAAMLLIAHVGHKGGVLVHVLGVQAMIPQ
jgi:uncharacterized membrane protein